MNEISYKGQAGVSPLRQGGPFFIPPASRSTRPGPPENCYEAPFDLTGHGTAVAGLAGAAAGNGIGIAGVAPGCRLMALRIDGPDMVFSFISALEYVIRFSRRHPDLRVVVNGSIQVVDAMAVHAVIIEAYEEGIVLFY